MSDVIFHAVEKIIYPEYQKCRWHDSRLLEQIALIRPALASFCKWGDGKSWGDWTRKLLIRWGHYSLSSYQELSIWSPVPGVFFFFFFFCKNCSKGKFMKLNLFVDKFKILGKKDGEITYGTDSRFAPSQWETVLLCNDVSHWLGTNPESALTYREHLSNSRHNI